MSESESPEIVANGEAPPPLVAVETLVESEPLPNPVLPETLETPPEPQPAPAPPQFTAPGQCPDCGKMIPDEKELRKHRLYQHTLPDARRKAIEEKTGKPPRSHHKKKPESPAAPAAHIPPPDFSDIPGVGAPVPQPSPIAVDPGARYEGMANMTFDMTTGLLTRIFGPEWQPTPDKDDPAVSHERMACVGAIKNYYQSVELPDIPPGYMLCFVALAYAAPRMAQNPTKTKLAQGWLWLKSKFQRRRSVAPVSRENLPHIVQA